MTLQSSRAKPLALGDEGQGTKEASAPPQPRIGKRPRTRATWRPAPSTLRLRAVAYLAALDLACIAGSFALAAALRGTIASDTSWAFVLSLLIPLYIVSALNARAFAAPKLVDPYRAVGKGIQCLLVALGLMTIGAFYLKTSETIPRLTVGLGFGLAAITLSVGRYTYTRNLNRIIGGDPYSSALIWDEGQPIPSAAFSVVIASDTLFDPTTDDPIMYDRLAKALEGVHNVVVSCHPQRRLAWANALKGANVQGEILMPELQPLAPLGANLHGSMTSLVVAHGPLSFIDRALKRGFDLVLATVGLILLAPLMIAVAIAIKRDTPGPIFFRQNRIGRGNQVFEVIKFRSMRDRDSDAGGERSTAREDDRVTRVGRFIRRTSIDELPQLLNVLGGSMSIVGPRPHALASRAADKLFWEVDGRYWHRHAAKPGLTGLAQVRGFRGATLEEDDLRNRLQADLEYLDTWSIWRDVKIIVMTAQVLFHRNAF